MTAHLQPIDVGPTIDVDKQIVIVGRSESCDVVIESKKISRQHCCLALLSDQLLARDLGSTNGIWKNGTRVDETTLDLGDVLTIGDVRFRVAELNGKAQSPTGQTSL